MRSISRVGVLLLSLVAGQAWAECGIGDADGVLTDAGQGNFDCSNFSNEFAPLGFDTVTLTSVIFNNSNKEVLSWSTTGGDQPDRLIGVGGQGARCVWEYNEGQTSGGPGLTLSGSKSFSDLIGCTDNNPVEPPPAPPPQPTSTADAECTITVNDSTGGDLDGTITGVVFGPDALGICQVSGSQKQCVSYCMDRAATPNTGAGEDCSVYSTLGDLPYNCRRCESAADFPNEQGWPYCVEYVDRYCATGLEDTCDTSQPASTYRPRAKGETTLVVNQEYIGSDCGLITVTLGGREYSRWVPCQ